MANKYLIIIILLVAAGGKKLFGQNLPPIQTDRPDQTECPFIVPPKHFQFESGFNYEKINQIERNFLYPSLLSKYGVNEKFELRLITESVTSKLNQKIISEITPVRAGFKTKLFDEKGALPAASFIAHLAIPFLSTAPFRSTYFAPDFRFTMQHSLSKKISLGYNAGAQWDGETPNPEFLYTITCGFSMSANAGLYAELYGFAAQSELPSHNFDGGIIYYIKPNFMIDVSSSFGLTANAPDYYLALGLSVRLPD